AGPSRRRAGRWVGPPNVTPMLARRSRPRHGRGSAADLAKPTGEAPSVSAWAPFRSPNPCAMAVESVGEAARSTRYGEARLPDGAPCWSGHGAEADEARTPPGAAISSKRATGALSMRPPRIRTRA